jgi:hypothetical protein
LCILGNKMKIIDQILHFPIKSWGEDRIFIGNNLVGVIDGSSPISVIPISPYHSQAEWLSDNLAQKIPLYSDASLPNICKKITDRLNASHSSILKMFNEATLPCAVLAGIQTQDNDIHGYVIGDCTLIIQFQSGDIKILTDNRIRHFSNLTRAIKNEALLSGKDAKEAVKKQMTQNRKVMNTADGFWTVSLKGTFQTQFLECHYKTEEIKKCLLFSDGFERIFSNSLYSISDILDGKVTLCCALHSLRNWERSSTNLDVKQHDDVSAVLIEL